MSSKKEYNDSRYHDRRNVAVSMLGGVCTRCGTTIDLQFDHIDPKTKLFNISDRLRTSVNDKDFWLELQKCQLLCRPHHEEKTGVEQTLTRAGELNPVSKLRELDVKYIRKLSELGHSQRAISREFDVNQSTVWKILNGVSWTHVV